MRPITMLPLLALGACVVVPIPGGVVVPPGEVRVVGAEASPTQVVMRMSNGERCRASRPEGETGNWSAVTGDCGYALPVSVFYRQGGNVARYRIEAPAGAIGRDGATVPRAEIFVIDVDGQRRLFTAPLDSSVRFEPQA